MKPIKHIKTGESGDGIQFIQSGIPPGRLNFVIGKPNKNSIMKYIQEIKTKGYTCIPQAFNNYQVDELLRLVKKYYEETKDKVSKDVPYLNSTSPNVYNLQNKDINFIHSFFNIEGVEEILKYFLNDKWYKAIPQDQPNYILRHLGARSSNEELPLHIDSFIPYKGEECLAMQVAIMLEDSTFEKGCTIIIPGTHQSGKYADNNHNGPPQLLEAKAGDVLIWDSRLWHGTTKNKTEGTRWAIIGTYTRWFIKQMFDIPKNVPYDIWQHLSNKQKSILGYNSRPFNTEFEGIDMKQGYK